MKGQSATYALAGIIVLVFLFFAETTPFVRINRNFVTIEFESFVGLANFSIIPIQYNNLDLGNSTNLWQDLFISNMINLNGYWISANGTTNVAPPLNFTANYINYLNNNTLHVAGWGTGDPINDENDLFVGDGRYGSISIGSDAQIARMNGVGQIGGLNASHVFILRHDETPIVNNLSFLFTSENRIRLAIPVAGNYLATYNPRSQMIGGDLGQQNTNDVVVCPLQGYQYIDCMTDVTGADLGVQDDLEVRGNIYGSVPYANMWFHNDSATGVPTVITSSDTWTNVSGFDQTGHEADQMLNGFTFVNGNALVAEFDGIYKVEYGMSYQKLTAAGVNHEFKTALFVNGEVQNSTEVHRTIKENDAVADVGGVALFNLSTGDVIYFNVLGQGHTVDVGTHAASVAITRVGN